MRVRSEVSEQNKYWLDKYRYLELKNFCMQYETFKKAYLSLDGYARTLGEHVDGGGNGDPTARCAEARQSFYERVKMIEDSAKEADGIVAPYLLLGVTEGLSYDILRARYGVPCCRNSYYDIYRRFFWLLSRKRL